VSVPDVEMTLKTMERFGVAVQRRDWESFHIRGGQTYRWGAHAPMSRPSAAPLCHAPLPHLLCRATLGMPCAIVRCPELPPLLRTHFLPGRSPTSKIWAGVRAPDGNRSPGKAFVEGDASSASYFLAGAAITGAAFAWRAVASTACR